MQCIEIENQPPFRFKIAPVVAEFIENQAVKFLHGHGRQQQIPDNEEIDLLRANFLVSVSVP